MKSPSRPRPRIGSRALLVAIALGLAAAYPLRAAPATETETPGTLQAVLVLRSKEAGASEFPERLAGEVVAHLQRTLTGSRVTSVQRGGGQLTLVVILTAADRLRFEKLVAELPAAPFSMPLAVESWNIEARETPQPASDDHALATFVLTVKESGTIEYVRLRGIPLKDVLATLARTAGLQYICSADAAERPVYSEIKGVQVEDFLKALGISLGLDVVRIKGFWCLGRRETPLRGTGGGAR